MTDNKPLPIRNADDTHLAGSQSRTGKTAPTAGSTTKLGLPITDASRSLPLVNDIQLSKIIFDHKMNNDEKRYFSQVTPNLGFETEFRIKITEEFDTSGGVGWTAAMIRNGVTVGEAENRGDGGCNYYYFDNRDDRQAWESQASMAYLGRSTGDDEDSLFTFLDYLTPVEGPLVSASGN